MRLYFGLCIALLAGNAWAWTTAADLSAGAVDIEEAPLEGTYGEGHTRGLLAAYPPGNRAVNKAAVTATNTLYCRDYNVGGSQSVNQAYRLAMQDVGRAAALFCTLPASEANSRGNFIAHMATTCRAAGVGKVKVLTNNIRSVKIPNLAKRLCFQNRVDDLVANGQYACFVKSHLTSAQLAWTPPGC